MSDVHEVLVKARNLLDRDGWCQYLFADGHGRHCAMGATLCFGPADANWGARNVLREVVAEEMLHVWNNAPGRTKAEVLAAFDRAIFQTAPDPAWDSLPTPESEVEASDTVEVGA